MPDETDPSELKEIAIADAWDAGDMGCGERGCAIQPTEPVYRHAHEPEVRFDDGDLDCDGGLLLLIRRHIHPLQRGGLLELLSTDSTVEVELPAWRRMTNNELVSWTKTGDQRGYLGSLINSSEPAA